MCTLDSLRLTYPEIPSDLWTMFNSLDAFTYNHSIRVCEMCQIVETAMQLPDKTLSEAGLFHDIGKYYVSRNILEKRGSLTATERNFINFHSFLSYDTLKRFGLPQRVCEIALCHHSTNTRVFGENIPECNDAETQRLALIIKTIDVFEAITSDRAYHRGLSVASAVKFFEDMEHDNEALTILVNAGYLNRE